MTKTLTFSIATAALLLSGAAYAQAPDPAERQTREARPEMTRDAVQENAAQMFARFDVNSDGVINAADRTERANAQAAARFAQVDTNSDGMISREEFAAIGATRAGPAAANREAGSPQPRGNRAARNGMAQARELLGQADSNSDRAITQDEFSAALLARFDAADANQDGVVSPQESRPPRPQAGVGQDGEAQRNR